MVQINRFEKKVRSQNGEDGIIEEIFRRIGTIHPYFVEFGVEDGLECNSANLSIHHNWSGLMIEGNAECYQRLLVHYSPYPQVKTAHHSITKDNIATIFQTMNVPAELDMLSIDIDGNDYWVWQALSMYKARLVVIEYNGAIPPPQKKVIQYNPDFQWNGSSYYGASLTSLHRLGKQLGYALLGTDSNGVNAFFLRSDLISPSGFSALTPEEAFHPLAYGPYPEGDGPYLKI